MKNKWYVIMMLPAFLLVAVFLYFPLARGVVMAFQNYNMFDLTDVHFIGLANFKAFMFNPNISFPQILINTLVWTFFSLVFQFVLGFTLALLLKKPFRGRGLYTGFVFYGYALSGFAIGILWSWLFNGQFGLFNDLLLKAGLLDEPAGFLSTPGLAMVSVIITNVWYGIPFFGIMLLAALQSVPEELYEAAVLDGCGAVRKLFFVTIPYIRPTIISTVLLRTMWIVNFADIIFAMTNGGPVNSTNILGTLMINTVFKEYDYGIGSAVGVFIMVLLLIYAVIYLKLTKNSEDSI